MAMKVIDLSHHNTIPESLQPAAKSGVVGIIHKATEGTSYSDDKFRARQALAEDAGLLFGAYHFMRPGSIKEQADWFVSVARPKRGMLLAADLEVDGISLGDLEEWLSRVEGKTGIRPVIYSGHTLKDLLGGQRHPVINGDAYRLWLAQYGDQAELPPGWSSYWLWQYTDKGEVPGVEPPTDLNDYQGSDEQLTAEWTHRRRPRPEPTPPLVGASITPEQLQAGLKAAGWYEGEVDGLWGELSAAACERWFESGGALDY